MGNKRSKMASNVNVTSSQTIVSVSTVAPPRIRVNFIPENQPVPMGKRYVLTQPQSDNKDSETEKLLAVIRAQLDEPSSNLNTPETREKVVDVSFSAPTPISSDTSRYLGISPLLASHSNNPHQAVVFHTDDHIEYPPTPLKHLINPSMKQKEFIATDHLVCDKCGKIVDGISWKIHRNDIGISIVSMCFVCQETYDKPWKKLHEDEYEVPKLLSGKSLSTKSLSAKPLSINVAQAEATWE